MLVDTRRRNFGSSSATRAGYTAAFEFPKDGFAATGGGTGIYDTTLRLPRTGTKVNTRGRLELANKRERVGEVYTRDALFIVSVAIFQGEKNLPQIWPWPNTVEDYLVLSRNKSE